MRAPRGRKEWAISVPFEIEVRHMFSTPHGKADADTFCRGPGEVARQSRKKLGVFGVGTVKVANYCGRDENDQFGFCSCGLFAFSNVSRAFG